MRSIDGRRRGLLAIWALASPSAIQVPRISLRTSWILIAPVLWGRWASADSIAISRLSRYCSSCSKQMYRTLAWPPEATLRAIWRAIVVLPVPCAPPISRSSPVRSPRADRLVERREPERDGLVLGDLAARDLVVEVDQHVQRRARSQAAVVGVEAPGRRRLRPSREQRVWTVVSGASVLTRWIPPRVWTVDRRVAPESSRIIHPDRIMSALGTFA